MREGDAIDRDDPRAGDNPGGEGRPAPQGVAHRALAVDRQAKRMGQGQLSALGHPPAFISVGLFLPHQPVACCLDPGERRGATGAIDPLAKESGPVVREYPIECGDDIVEVIRRDPSAAMAEKGLREIVEPLASAGAGADQLVGFQPDQRTFVVIVLAARQRVIGLWFARGEHRIERGIGQRPPGWTE